MQNENQKEIAGIYFKNTRHTKIYTLSLHDALPILNALLRIFAMSIITPKRKVLRMSVQDCWRPPAIDRKSGSAGMPRPTSYAVFCLKKIKCNWTIRKRLPRCKMRLKKRLLAFSRRL